MKKILSFLFLFISVLMFGQDSTSSKKYTPYVSAGLSISSSNDFSLGSYPSIEIGLSGKNISGGLIFGRSSLKGLGEKSDVIASYFYEAKTSISKSINNSASIYGLFGIGIYGDFKRNFIEYGAGFSYSFGKLSYFVQSSNWDNTWYITPELTFNF
jgi:hypothetical protein